MINFSENKKELENDFIYKNNIYLFAADQIRTGTSGDTVFRVLRLNLSATAAFFIITLFYKFP